LIQFKQRKTPKGSQNAKNIPKKIGSSCIIEISIEYKLNQSEIPIPKHKKQASSGSSSTEAQKLIN